MSTTERPRATLWAQPDDGLWVASATGEHLGLVEEATTGFIARNSRGEIIGTFRRLEDARRAVDGSTAAAPRHSSETVLLTTAVVTGLLAMIVAGLGVWVTVS